MRQIIQNLGNGKTSLVHVPDPAIQPGHVLIQTRKSLVSAGTERMLVEFGKANFVKKALLQPERVGMLIDKIRADGWWPAIKGVRNKLDTPIALGYCNVGMVMAVGADVTQFRIGDRVVSNGPHAEVVSVPKNLVAKIPDNVSDDEAVFTVPAAIALHGIRLMNPALGETVVVLGMGLIGLLAAEVLRISGCRVIGIDLDDRRLEIAATKNIITYNANSGAVDRFVYAMTEGLGADAVVITASSKSNDIISQAFNMARRRGRVVLIGDVGLNMARADLHEKELTFQVSCSYGAGRYDRSYEEKGIDYPIAQVRWTANRNFKAILQQLSTHALDVKHIATRYLPLEDFGEVYRNMSKTTAVATIFTYPNQIEHIRNVVHQSGYTKAGKGVIGIIGAGNFTKNTVLPILKNNRIKYIASASGLSGTLLATKYNIAISTSDYQDILADSEVDLVMITTRHDLHASLAMEALKRGKHVFVEKPLAIHESELTELVTTCTDSRLTQGSITVGFNRRFSPFAQKMKALLGDHLMHVTISINAGLVPADSWLLDRHVGGGRILGEGCHFVDLACYLTGSKISSVCASAMENESNDTAENVSMLLHCENGSSAAIHYFSNGHKAYAKERVEVCSLGRTLILDNFQTLTGYGFRNFSSLRLSQDKGHKALFGQLLERMKTGGAPIIPFDELVNSTRATLAVLESLKLGGWIKL